MQVVRQGEHQMEVRYRQQLAPPLCQPGFLGAGLAQRAMPIAAGVIHVAGHAAVIAGLDMPAQGCRATGDDGAPDLRLGCRQDMRRAISRTVATQDGGQTHAGDSGTHARRSEGGQVAQLKQFQR